MTLQIVQARFRGVEGEGRIRTHLFSGLSERTVTIWEDMGQS